MSACNGGCVLKTIEKERDKKLDECLKFASLKELQREKERSFDLLGLQMKKAYTSNQCHRESNRLVFKNQFYKFEFICLF